MLKIITKLNDFIKASGGYKGFIPVIIAILVLGIALLVLQQNWIKKEWNAVKTEIEEKTKRETKVLKKKGVSEEPLKPLTEDTMIQKQHDVTLKILQTKKNKEADINKRKKEGDLFFEYDQYEKAVNVYEKLTNEHFVFEESDKVFARLGKSYYNLEDYESALGAYKKVYHDYLSSSYKLDAQLGMGKCLIQIGNYDEARRILYFLVGKEAKYKDDEDKEKVIEAYYGIADSYVEQAKASLK